MGGDNFSWLREPANKTRCAAGSAFAMTCACLFSRACQSSTVNSIRWFWLILQYLPMKLFVPSSLQLSIVPKMRQKVMLYAVSLLLPYLAATRLSNSASWHRFVFGDRKP